CQRCYLCIWELSGEINPVVMGVVRHPTKHLRVEVTNWCQCHSTNLSNHTIWENIPGSLSVSRHTKCGHVRELIITGSDITFCRFSQLKVCEKTSYILSTQISQRIVQRLFARQCALYFAFAVGIQIFRRKRNILRAVKRNAVDIPCSL
ncbi:hypothetical protein, partial [Escherichia coli]|uniref:hypothetical protein n=1 Tax=Escherichia coli TaxID=562 RepID=UPI001C703C49